MERKDVKGCTSNSFRNRQRQQQQSQYDYYAMLKAFVIFSHDISSMSVSCLHLNLDLVLIELLAFRRVKHRTTLAWISKVRDGVSLLDAVGIECRPKPESVSTHLNRSFCLSLKRLLLKSVVKFNPRPGHSNSPIFSI